MKILTNFFIGYKIKKRGCVFTWKGRAMENEITSDSLVEVIQKEDIRKALSLISDRKGINTPDSEGVFPLIAAIEKERVDIVKALMKAGADVQVRDSCGNTVLINSILHNGLENGITDLLLDSDVDIDAQNKKGETALMCAIERGNVRTSSELLRRGCSVDYQDKDGNTALIRSVLFFLDETMIRILLQNHADINIRNHHGETALSLAAFFGTREQVGFLLDKGASVNTQNSRGDTPLMNAIYRMNEENVEALLKKGADITIKNERGETVMDYVQCEPYSRIHELLERQQRFLNKRAELKTMLFEDLIHPDQSKELFDLLAKMGSLASVLEAESVNDYEKLKKVYHEVIPYAQNDTSQKRKIQNAFIKKQKQLREMGRE